MNHIQEIFGRKFLVIHGWVSNIRAQTVCYDAKLFIGMGSVRPHDFINFLKHKTSLSINKVFTEGRWFTFEIKEVGFEAGLIVFVHIWFNLLCILVQTVHNGLELHPISFVSNEEKEHQIVCFLVLWFIFCTFFNIFHAIKLVRTVVTFVYNSDKTSRCGCFVHILQITASIDHMWILIGNPIQIYKDCKPCERC